MDQLSLILKILSIFVTKQTVSMRSTLLSLSLQLVFPGLGYTTIINGLINVGINHFRSGLSVDKKKLLPRIILYAFPSLNQIKSIKNQFN